MRSAQPEAAPPRAIPIGVVVASDRAAGGVYEDRGGPAVVAYLKRALTTAFRPHVVICRDD